MNWEGRHNAHNKYHITKFFIASFLLVLALSVQNVRPEDFSDGSDAATLSNNCQLDNVLQSLLTPKELGSIQVRALRQELLRILNSQAINDNIDLPDYDLLSDGKLLYDESIPEDKRSIASLAKSGQFPYENKRKIESLARSGYYRFGKRSIANLAKNGQLPTLQAPEEEEISEEEKRSVASLAKSGAINRYFKRGLESLARSGYMPGKRYDYYESGDKKNVGALARNGYMKREIDNFLGDLYQKRYIGSLAKQYNFPTGKRNVGSLARNGELYRYNRNNYYDNSFDSDKRNVQSLMKNSAFYGGKRNIASLARSQNTPFYNRYEQYKRNIGAIARDWSLPNHSTTWDHQEDEKRNVAALLRQDSYLHSVNRNSAVDAHPTPELGEEHQSEDKRNLASLKAQATSGYYSNRNKKRSVPVSEGSDKVDNHETPKSADHMHESRGRSKRQADDYFAVNSEEYPVPVMQNANGFDYEDLVQALAERYPNNEKRFLGNIPLSRMAELGKISFMGHAATSNSPPTSPTYRRRQYLLSRTLPEETD